MNLFRRRPPAPEPAPIPQDPNDALVEHIRNTYPFGKEALGMRSLIRMTVFTVLEMKKRGLI